MCKYLSVSNGVLKELSKEDVPKDIYHYTSPEGLKGIIENKNLWFTDRFCLNDKSEGYYVLELFEKNIDLILSDTPLIDKKDEIINSCKTLKEGFVFSKMRLYQISFSLDSDSLCMWNYYTKGDNIQGYSLHFNSKELCDSIEKKYKVGEKPYPYLLRGKVDYCVDTQIEKIKHFITDIYYAILEDSNNNEHKAIQTFLNRFSNIFERIALIGSFFKANCFSIENEYRIAIDLFVKDGESMSLNEKSNDGIINKKSCKITYNHSLYVPHFELDFEPNVLKEIKLSPTLDFDLAKNNLDFLLTNNDYKSTKITQSDIPVRY